MHKRRIHSMVSQAIKSGKLHRGPCETCGATEHIDAHHDDYSKPYDVRWLCHSCHMSLHAHDDREHYVPEEKLRLLPYAQELRRQGKTYRQIGRLIGRSPGSVFKWLNDVSYY
jgi:transposase-like protein